jgi:hypothetical protein
MQWEYTTVTQLPSSSFIGGRLDTEEFERQLNELGREGWEVVSAFGLNQSGGLTRQAVVLLKRAVEE